MLLLDAVLTGAKGVNLWASFRTPPPQRSARLYRALVNGGFASAVNGGGRFGGCACLLSVEDVGGDSSAAASGKANIFSSV